MSADDAIERRRTYCGLGRAPKGKVIGSDRACMKFGQVRRFGVEKIAQEILDAYWDGVRSAKMRRDRAYRQSLARRLARTEGRSARPRPRAKPNASAKAKAPAKTRVKKRAAASTGVPALRRSARLAARK